MDGEEYDRDDRGDTQIHYRFGEDSSVDETAHGDSGHPQPPNASAPLRPEPGLAPPTYRAARWGETSDYGQASFGASRQDPSAYGQTSYGQTSYGQTSYGQTSYGQTSYGQTSSGQPSFPESQPGQPPLSEAADEPPPFRQAHYGQVPDTEPSPSRSGYEQVAFERSSYEPSPYERSYDQRSASTRTMGRPDEDESETSGEWRLSRRSAEGPGAVDDESGRRGRTTTARRSMPLWQELPLLLVVAFCLAVLIRTFLLQAFYIPSSSMEETLLVGDRVLVNKIVYDVRQPARGEVIVFAGPANWTPENPQATGGGVLSRIGRTLSDLVGVSRPGEKDFVKRVIGVPGDRVSCCDPAGRVYLNGKGLDEPYIHVNSSLDVQPNPRSCGSRRFDEVLVPPGQLFVMGDHRGVSQDSRCQGTVPIENVVGRAFVIVWPSSRWDSLSVPDTFADVPAPVAVGMRDSAPAPPADVAAAATVPILASLAATARSGRNRWRRPGSTLPT